jgi:hypothetical protein
VLDIPDGCAKALLNLADIEGQAFYQLRDGKGLGILSRSQPTRCPSRDVPSRHDIQ